MTRVAWSALLLLLVSPAPAQTLKVLTAGAFKEVVLGVVPAFEAQSGLEVEVANDTAGALIRSIEAGQGFDLVVVTREGIERLATGGRVEPGTRRDLATVGIGVAVRQGAPAPPLATVEQFKEALRAARRIAYIDPASGGSSGIYLDGLFKRLGMAEIVRPKAVLVPGGAAAERLVSGEADLAIHQISEILPVKGVTLAGVLPAEIQHYTTYAGGISPQTAAPDAARALLAALASVQAADLMRARGMLPAPAPTEAR